MIQRYCFRHRRFGPARHAVAIGWLIALSGCACSRDDGESEQARIREQTHALIDEQLREWHRAARALEAAAPTPSDRGWDSARDQAALATMKTAWLDARRAYELIEGSIAPIFPESDAATDARYDDFLAQLGPNGDRDPFDGEGVIGMHAIERVLWADSVPQRVVYFERALPGYSPASMPSTEVEARRFRAGLAARLTLDVERLRQDFATVSLDIAFAFRGLIDLAVEQAEKVDLAASGREESRYARTTMRDLRANYEGCLAAYELFRPWLFAQPGGKAVDGRVHAAFERLRQAYARVDGDDIPEPPQSWSSLAPTSADLETPFGQLFSVVSRECDADVDGSLHRSLVDVAETLGLPKRVTH